MRVQFTLRRMFFVVGVASAAAIFLAQLVSKARNEAAESSCVGRFSQIRMAITNYCSSNNHNLPSNVFDSDGRPQHSWRVLLLPYLGYENLYREYDFSESWNGPKNSRLIEKMPAEYSCPVITPSKGITNVVAVFPNSRQAKMGIGFKRETTQRKGSFIITESVNSHIVWTEPNDYYLGNFSLEINDSRTSSISSPHPRGPNYFSQSWDIRQISPSTSPSELIEMIVEGN